jgi:methionyl aminopeptidase
MITYVDAETKSRRTAGVIPLHGEAGFAGMRKASRLTAEALDLLVDAVQPGVTTAALDRMAYEFARDHGAIPATLFYKGYRYSTCTSLNHVVCHGMPDERPLREGDIVNIDITLIVDGWYGDSSRMYPVGEISRKAERLIEVTYAGLEAGIAAARPGNTTGDIGSAIQTLAEAERMSVVRDFVGHGVGQLFHDEPNIMHFGPHPVPRQEEPPDRRRGAAGRHGRPHAGLPARSDQALAGTGGDGHHPRPQPSLRRPIPVIGRRTDDAADQRRGPAAGHHAARPHHHREVRTRVAAGAEADLGTSTSTARSVRSLSPERNGERWDIQPLTIWLSALPERLTVAHSELGAET